MATSVTMPASTSASTQVADDAPHLLIVDDDRRIRDLLSRFLGAEGYRVSTADSVADARSKLHGLSFDLIICDWMMPGESGVEFTRALRDENSHVPIIMLTAKHETEFRIEGLQSGVDDYLPKPFEPRELALRVASILKRAQPAASPAPEQVSFGKFVFHIGRGELRSGEDIIKLTDRERNMLRTLAATPGETVRREALAGNGDNVSERAVDVQINRLRRKVEKNPANPLYIQTVRGLGYRLVISS